MAKGVWLLLNVADVARSIDFYKALGLRVTQGEMMGSPYGHLDLGGTGMMLWGKDNLGPDQPADTKAWLSGEMGKGIIVGVGVPNARKSWEKAQAMKAKIDSPLEAQPWGGHGFNVVDPDGFVLNITDKFAPLERPKPRAKPKARPKPTARSAATRKKTGSRKKR